MDRGGVTLLHFEAIPFWLPLGSAKLHCLKNIGWCAKAHCYPTSLVTGEVVEPLLHFSRSHPASMQGRPSFPCPSLPAMHARLSLFKWTVARVRSLHLSLLLFLYAPANICDGEKEEAGFYPKVDLITNNSNFGCSPLPLSQNRRVRQD